MDSVINEDTPKISTIIAELNEILVEYGDLPIITGAEDDCDCFGSFDVCVDEEPSTDQHDKVCVILYKTNKWH